MNSFKYIVSTAILSLMMSESMALTKLVAGADLSLVPAYEKAGDVWLDASGMSINTTYADGMITYVKEVAKWNSIRVRLFVDPTKDSDLATCQDIEYVKTLGARIKAAGLDFLLDIHYSDTWADPKQQKIPASWGFGTSTSNEVMAEKVYTYTTSVLQDLKSAGATPDYVQVGNEISYGMLLRSNNDKVYPASSYNATTWGRLAMLVGQGCKAVREQCPQAKIILHIERAASDSQTTNFFSYLQKAGLADDAYDIVGLSYYPFWHGQLSQLEATIKALDNKFPDKEVQIVEIGWNCNEYYPGDATYAANKFSWGLSPEGQDQMLNELIPMLKIHPNVTGIYYWCPEECGNAANSAGVNQVMNGWMNRGFWELTWKSGQHKLISEGALNAISTFLPEESHISELDIENTDAPLYDILGRRVEAPIKGHIYIKNGRKAVF